MKAVILSKHPIPVPNDLAGRAVYKLVFDGCLEAARRSLSFGHLVHYTNSKTKTLAISDGARLVVWTDPRTWARPLSLPDDLMGPKPSTARGMAVLLKELGLPSRKIRKLGHTANYDMDLTLVLAPFLELASAVSAGGAFRPPITFVLGSATYRWEGGLVLDAPDPDIGQWGIGKSMPQS